MLPKKHHRRLSLPKGNGQAPIFLPPHRGGLRVIIPENIKDKGDSVYKRNPVTLTLMGVNLVFFVLSISLGGGDFFRKILDGGDLETLLQLGAQLGILVQSGEVFRIVTALFLHGGLLHFAFNSYALYYFGTVVENLYTSPKFLVVYAASGIVGNLLTHLFAFGVVSVGASGAIFGLVGLLFAMGLKKETPAYQKAFTGRALLPMILINLFLGFSVPGINNMAHIGGLATGFLLGWILKPGFPRTKTIFLRWQLLAGVVAFVLVVCVLLVFLMPMPPVEKLVSFNNRYAQLLNDFSVSSDPASLSFQIRLLQPFDSSTRALVEQAENWVEQDQSQSGLAAMEQAFSTWQEEVLSKYGSLIQKVP